MSNELRVTLPARVSELRDLATMVEDFGDANNLPAPKVFAINGVPTVTAQNRTLSVVSRTP